MLSFLMKNKKEMMFLLISSVLVSIGCYIQVYGFQITFLDTDDYMRLVRIRDFFQNGDWYNNIISRSNYPIGCDLHWTKFYDLFIIVPVYILNLFLNSINNSIDYVCFVISPIVKCVTVLFLYSLFSKLLKKENAIVATTIFLASPMLLPFHSFGRPDHHAFIMLFIVIYAHNISCIILNAKEKKHYICAAFTNAACIWISPETLIPLLIADFIIFLHFFNKSEMLHNLYIKNITTIACMSVIVFSTQKIAISNLSILASLLVLIPYFTNHTNALLKYWNVFALVILFLMFHMVMNVEYDKISVIHICLYICNMLFFSINSMYTDHDKKQRIMYAFLWGTAIACVFCVSFPKFIYGMSADVDEYAKNIWLYRVSEMRSPLLSGDGLFYCTFAFIITVSIINKTIDVLSKKFQSVDLLWYILISTAGVYTIFSGFSYRMLPYAALFSIPLIVDLCTDSIFVKNLNRYVRVFCAFTGTIFFMYCTVYLKQDDGVTQHKNIATKKELWKKIDAISDKPVTIIAHTNFGAELLYYTKHNVVAAPYHRQTIGIVRSDMIINKPFCEDIFKEIIKKTTADYILLDKNQSKYSERIKNHDYLIDLIEGKKLPRWLSVVDIKDEKNVFLLKIANNIIK